MFNNEVKSLNYKPRESGKVELIDYTNTEGKRVYVRGIMYVMSMAINEVFKDALFTINYQLDNSMFCTFENMETTEEVLEKIKAKMIEIINEDILKVDLNEIIKKSGYKSVKIVANLHNLHLLVQLIP